MEPETKKYQLTKDMPDFKAGEVFTFTVNDFGDKYYQSEHNDDWGLPRMYPIATIENNPQWFIDASLPIPEEENKYAPVKDGVETEIIKITSSDEKGKVFSYDALIPKNFNYVTCQYCQTGNLIWCETAKNHKKMMVRLNDQGQWITHMSECPHFKK